MIINSTQFVAPTEYQVTEPQTDHSHFTRYKFFSLFFLKIFFSFFLAFTRAEKNITYNFSCENSFSTAKVINITQYNSFQMEILLNEKKEERNNLKVLPASFPLSVLVLFFMKIGLREKKP